MYDNSRKFREPSKLYFSSCNYYIIFLIILISSLKNAFFTINYSFGDLLQNSTLFLQFSKECVKVRHHMS